MLGDRPIGQRTARLGPVDRLLRISERIGRRSARSHNRLADAVLHAREPKLLRNAARLAAVPLGEPARPEAMRNRPRVMPEVAMPGMLAPAQSWTFARPEGPAEAAAIHDPMPVGERPDDPTEAEGPTATTVSGEDVGALRERM